VQTLLIAVLLALFAFAIFGPLANLLLWAFAEKWYFPSKIPSEFGFRSGRECSVRAVARFSRSAPASGSRCLPSS
jgi:hypothetical protein